MAVDRAVSRHTLTTNLAESGASADPLSGNVRTVCYCLGGVAVVVLNTTIGRIKEF